MMHLTGFLPTLSLMFILTIFTSIHIPRSFCQNQHYITCGVPYRCGNISFTYPFWGRNRPNSCGFPGFEVSCRANIPRLTVPPVTYRILFPVNTITSTLTVARDDLWSDDCPQFLHNTTFSSNFFNDPKNLYNLTLSYNCTTPPNLAEQPPNQFACSANDTGTATAANFFTTTEANNTNAKQLQVACDSSIWVPITQPAAQNLATTGAVRAALTAGFRVQYEANNSICSECTRSGGRCGYNTSANSFACYCSDRPHDRVCNRTSFRSQKGYFIAIAVAGTVEKIAVCIIYCLVKRRSFWEATMCWRSDEERNEQVVAFMKECGSIAPKLYKYSEIKKMTNSFADILGHGGYGSVYRGKLSDGRLVAVKVLNDNKGNGDEFMNEVASICRTSHVNVVNLLGYCYDRKKRALIYEFMPNGSLDRFIHGKQSSQDTNTDCQLEWKTLYEIAVGTARGLEYLHRGCNTRIVHFDIKPHNILLDKDFCPKISDFGLARICKRKQSILSSAVGARGTAGYIAPEVFYHNFGGTSHKSDVYSYGMMLLEIAGLRWRTGSHSEQTSEEYFPNCIYKHLELGKDPEVEGVMDQEEEETSRKMILIGLWCIQTNPADRPSMSKVVEMLEGRLEHLKIPPRPCLHSPLTASESPQESWTSSISG